MTNEELAELERLQPIAELLNRMGNGDMAETVIATAREAEALRAENARLRVGLETIRDTNPAILSVPVAQEIARAALEQGEVK